VQLLTAPPRDALTTAQVLAILNGDTLQVEAGLELLTTDLQVVADISSDLQGGKITRSMVADIHGTCRLTIDRELVWGVDLVRPYQILTAGGLSARWNLGVYVLTTPERTVDTSTTSYDVAGYDRLQLLTREVGEAYTVPAGTDYYTALTQAFTDAGLSGVDIDGVAQDYLVPADRVWSLVAKSTNPDQTTTPATWLRVINDLLLAINFRPVWADENGRYRCQQYAAPATRAPEFTFDADATATLLGESRTVVQDVWAVPNKWVFRQSNRPAGAPAPTEGDGIYTVQNDVDGATSVTSRGLTWPSVIDFEAASQAVLVDLGNRRVTADLQVAQTFKVSTGPFPAAGHADVFTYRDVTAGADLKVQALTWAQDLSGDDTTWTWEAIA
jgi:hypothetical protein